VQALCQKFAANVATATELRRQEVAETGHLQTQYPHHPKVYQTVIWKDQALQVLPNGRLRLPVGGQRLPLLLPLPVEYRQALIVLPSGRCVDSRTCPLGGVRNRLAWISSCLPCTRPHE
jgi:hypothetical protein